MCQEYVENPLLKRSKDNRRSVSYCIAFAVLFFVLVVSSSMINSKVDRNLENIKILTEVVEMNADNITTNTQEIKHIKDEANLIKQKVNSILE